MPIVHPVIRRLIEFGIPPEFWQWEGPELIRAITEQDLRAYREKSCR